MKKAIALMSLFLVPTVLLAGCAAHRPQYQTYEQQGIPLNVGTQNPYDGDYNNNGIPDQQENYYAPGYYGGQHFAGGYNPPVYIQQHHNNFASSLVTHGAAAAAGAAAMHLYNKSKQPSTSNYSSGFASRRPSYNYYSTPRTSSGFRSSYSRPSTSSVFSRSNPSSYYSKPSSFSGFSRSSSGFRSSSRSSSFRSSGFGRRR